MTPIEHDRIIFLDTETSNWTWDPECEQYYWHRFFSHQPGLNFDNPEVQQAILDVVRFRLDIGLDGLRLDAVPYLYERDGTNGENLPGTHQSLKRLRKDVDAAFPGKVLLAEANQWPIEVVDWGTFLRNHDEVTLEMVTEEERDYMYTEYATDPRMKLNLGIRRRLAPLVENDRSVECCTQCSFHARQSDPLLRRRAGNGRQHLPGRPRQRANADALEPRPQTAASAGRTSPGCNCRP